MSNLLQDHIDDPIKKCVVGMALLGFSPAMSCCGFSYKGEKVKKEHLKTYLYLSYDKMDFVKKALLIDIAKVSRWTISFIPEVFVDFYPETWSNDHPWRKIGCPHEHEVHVLAINRLEKAIAMYSEKFLPSVSITDGNLWYKQTLGLKYWQYDPAEDWVVTPKTFDEL